MHILLTQFSKEFHLPSACLHHSSVTALESPLISHAEKPHPGDLTIVGCTARGVLALAVVTPPMLEAATFRRGAT